MQFANAIATELTSCRDRGCRCLVTCAVVEPSTPEVAADLQLGRCRFAPGGSSLALPYQPQPGIRHLLDNRRPSADVTTIKHNQPWRSKRPRQASRDTSWDSIVATGNGHLSRRHDLADAFAGRLWRFAAPGSAAVARLVMLARPRQKHRHRLGPLAVGPYWPARPPVQDLAVPSSARAQDGCREPQSRR